MIETIREDSTIIRIAKSEKISKGMDVFYNPIMKTNRDVSVLLLKALGRKKMSIGLPLEGTGIRGIRFLKELERGQIGAIAFNDYSKKAVTSIKKNLELNEISISRTSKKANNDKNPNKGIKDSNTSSGNKQKGVIEIHCEDASLFLLNSKGFDYIDIDPFGSSNPFLDSAVKRISRGGILAITNTDTASLAGTYPKVCKRLYWAIPKHGHQMHEIGLRILIRKVQLIGAQHDKALIPVFSYFRDHYFRIFFGSVKSKDACDEIIAKHGMFENAGPMWMGQLWDASLTEKMFLIASASEKEHNEHGSIKERKAGRKNESIRNKKATVIENKKEFNRFLKTIKEESKIRIAGFFDTHQLAGSRIIKKEVLIEKLKRQGFQASSTHFLGTAIRTDAPIGSIEKLART